MNCDFGQAKKEIKLKMNPFPSKKQDNQFVWRTMGTKQPSNYYESNKFE